MALWAHTTSGNSHRFSRPQWQSLCRVLSAGKCLPLGLCKGTVKESSAACHQALLPSSWLRRLLHSPSIRTVSGVWDMVSQWLAMVKINSGSVSRSSNQQCILALIITIILEGLVNNRFYLVRPVTSQAITKWVYNFKRNSYEIKKEKYYTEN